MKLGALKAEIRRTRIVVVRMLLPDGEVLLPVIKDSLARIMSARYGPSKMSETPLTLVNGQLRLTREFSAAPLAAADPEPRESEPEPRHMAAPATATESTDADTHKAWRRGFLAGVMIGASLDEAAERDTRATKV